MDDLISRQAAIEGTKRIPDLTVYAFCSFIDMLTNMPTAEPNDEEAYEAGYTAAQMELKDAYKPKKGEWIPVVDGNYIIWECSECHVESDAWTDFCPICGSRNIEEMDED